MVGAIVALQALIPIPALAVGSEEPLRQEGEDRWVPSLAISGGANFQDQKGCVNSDPGKGNRLCEAVSDTTIPVRGFVDGDDLVVAPFVGAALEVMTPALPIPSRPRLFLSGEILPTFASDRDVALEGDSSSCISGPEPFDPCSADEPVPPTRPRPYSEDAANGQGSVTTANIDTLIWGANVGLSFPVRIGKRQLRIKPSFAWLNYKVDADGKVQDAMCIPGSGNSGTANVCTDNLSNANPEGNLREVILTASDSKRFNGIGPGLDVELDTGRFGWLGVSLFLGGRAYYILDDRKISFGTAEPYAGTNDVGVASFEVEVDRWIYRAHLGIRFHWLGNQN